MQEQEDLHLRDYGYSIGDMWSSRIITLIDAVMDHGIMSVMERLNEVGQYHSIARQDSRDLKILFPLSEEELKNNYKDGIPHIIRMLDYTEEQHKEMARKVIINYENDEIMMPNNKKQKLSVSETDYDSVDTVDSEEPEYEKLSVAETEETIEVITVENSPLGSLDPMPTEDDLKQNAEFLIYDTHEKMLGMFSRFIEQFQNKEIQENMTHKISGYLNEFVEYKSYCVYLAYEEVTQKLKDVLHEEDREWHKEEQKMFETVKYLSSQKIHINEGIENANNIAKKRRKSLLELKKLDNDCFRKFKKEYKEKYDFYTKKKKEKIMEIQDSARKIKDLERQIESVKDHKSMLRKELNLKEIRACNSTLRKIYKKIYDCYANTDILYHERYNYEVLALGLDILE